MSENLAEQVEPDAPQEPVEQRRPGWQFFIVVLFLAIIGLNGLFLIRFVIMTMSSRLLFTSVLMAAGGVCIIFAAVVLCIGLLRLNNRARIGAMIFFGIGIAQLASLVAIGSASTSTGISAITLIYLVYWLNTNRRYFH